MARSYKNINYFDSRPDIVKIFEELESFLDWCRLEMAPFDESHLYNRNSWAWRNYEKSKRNKQPGYRVRNNYSR